MITRIQAQAALLTSLLVWGSATTALGKEAPKLIEKSLTTKESVVEIQGKRFRKIEIQKEAFYIETLDSSKTNAEIRVLCQQGSGELLPAQAQAGVKTGQRSAFVIEGMRQICKEASGGRREVALDPAIMAGLELKLGKEQNKKVLVTPVGVTFKADW